MPESLGEEFHIPSMPFDLSVSQLQGKKEEASGKTGRGNVVQPPRGKVAEMAKRIEMTIESEKKALEPAPKMKAKPTAPKPVAGEKVTALKATFEGSKESASTQKKIKELHPETIIVHENEEYNVPMMVYEKEEYTLPLNVQKKESEAPLMVYEKEEYDVPFMVHEEEEYTLSLSDIPTISSSELVESLHQAHSSKAIETELSEASAEELDQFTSEFVHTVENLAKSPSIPNYNLFLVPEFHANLGEICQFLLKNNDRLTPKQREVLEKQMPKYREEIVARCTAQFVSEAKKLMQSGELAEDANSFSTMFNRMGKISTFLLNENKNLTPKEKELLAEGLISHLLEKGVDQGFIREPKEQFLARWSTYEPELQEELEEMTPLRLERIIETLDTVLTELQEKKLTLDSPLAFMGLIKNIQTARNYLLDPDNKHPLNQEQIDVLDKKFPAFLGAYLSEQLAQRGESAISERQSSEMSLSEMSVEDREEEEWLKEEAQLMDIRPMSHPISHPMSLEKPLQEEAEPKALQALEVRNPDTFTGFEEVPLEKVDEMVDILMGLKEELVKQNWRPKTYSSVENIFGNIQTILNKIEANKTLSPGEKENSKIEIQSFSDYASDFLIPLLAAEPQDFGHVAGMQPHQIDEMIAIPKAIVQRNWVPKTPEEANTMQANLLRLRVAIDKSLARQKGEASFEQELDMWDAIQKAMLQCSAQDTPSDDSEQRR